MEAGKFMTCDLLLCDLCTEGLAIGYYNELSVDKVYNVWVCKECRDKYYVDDYTTIFHSLNLEAGSNT